MERAWHRKRSEFCIRYSTEKRSKPNANENVSFGVVAVAVVVDIELSCNTTTTSEDLHANQAPSILRIATFLLMKVSIGEEFPALRGPRAIAAAPPPMLSIWWICADDMDDRE